ncbi:hypothetical protein ACFXDH_51285 [Streptomyces sp. NPDC059467]|uniref:hypothetical protein n=1 Tax=Streptomyces sp. NPDC059467 TaxID=3346844 RepID=UPI0036872F53
MNCNCRNHKLVRELDLALDSIREGVRAVDGFLVLDLATPCDRLITLALALDLAVDRDREGVLDHLRAIGRVLDHIRLSIHSLARQRDRDSLRVRGRVRFPGLDLNCVRDLVLALDNAVGCVRVLEARLLEELGRGYGVRVGWCAGWLVRVACRMVPVGERGRYAEEWRGELWELGEGRRRRRRQVMHAVRLAGRAWGVRGGVLAARWRTTGGG